MILFVLRIPPYPITRNVSRRLPRLRTYTTQPQSSPVCPPAKPPPKKPTTGTKYTLGALTVASVATIAYAKYDPDFRKWLGDNVSGADAFFKFLFQEEQTYMEAFRKQMETVQNAFGRKKIYDDDDTSSKDKNIYAPPRAVFPSLIKEEKEEKFNEIRVQKDSGKVDIVAEKPKSVDGTSSAYHPKSVSELELKINESAANAVDAYNRAEKALKDYSRKVEILIEESVEKLDPKIWSAIKEKSEAKEEVLKKAKENADKATKDLEIFQGLLDDKDFVAPEEARATARRNISRLRDDIARAKDDFNDVKKQVELTEKYWKQVEAARCHFIEELEILFPDFNISKKQFKMHEADLDLFLVHVFGHVLHLQKELKRIELIGQMRLKMALDGAKKGDPNFNLVEIAINEGVEDEKKKLHDEFQKKCLQLRKESERELRHRLKCQEQAHLDHLSDRLVVREQELEREFNRKLDEQMINEQVKYKTQVAAVIARMNGMKNAIVERVEADKIAHQSQVLWSACQALHRAVKISLPGVAWKDQIKPLQNEVNAIKSAATEKDELVAIVLAGIPEEALKRGVYPEDAIRERFLKVERVARRLALIPESGGRLPLYLLSYIQSLLLVNPRNPIPQAELNDEIIDFSKLDTYDILQRARYWVDRGNYIQTLKYMNLLQGASRCVASDWIRETRILLETQQAAETLMAHAIACGLLHL